MLDDLLSRKAFEEKYRAMGYSDEQVGREWAKAESDFMILCVDSYLNMVPAEERTKLEEFANEKSEDGARKFFEELDRWLAENPGIIDEAKIKDEAAVKIKSKLGIS